MSALAGIAGALEAKKKSLKKVEDTRDNSAPKVNDHAILSEADVDSYHKAVQDANIEEWEGIMSEAGLTFATRYLALSIEEAEAFLEVCEAHMDAQEKKTKGNGEAPKVASESSLAMVKKVEERLQALIDESGWSEQGVFVKTSSRSAKDAAVAQEQLIREFKAYVKRAEPNATSYSINARVAGLLHAGTQMLRCHNAKSAIGMLSQSERIEQDMRLALMVHSKHPERGWKEHLVIRPWVVIDVAQEWRCFMHKRQITAISQYNYLPFFKDLVDNRQYLLDILLKFLNERVIPILPEEKFQDSVIDVAITGDVYKNPECWVIELNPYLESTDSALFSWNKDYDVLTGRKPFEFRLTEKPCTQGTKVSMVHEWRELVDLEID